MLFISILQSTEEQKLIYSGKLLSDNSILKDVLREYEGQEAHTVHLVFTPKANKSKFDNTSRQSTFPETSSSNSSANSSRSAVNNTSSTTMNNSANELRQRHVTTSSQNTRENTETPRASQQTPAATIIPGSFNSAQQMSASNMLAQHYAMQAWMHQAYTNYMSQVASYYEQNQQQIPQNFAYLPPQMPYMPTSPTPSTPSSISSSIQGTNEAVNPEVNAPQPQPQQAVEAEQRRFPNIVQEEQENRDWLDILYSMSRLTFLLCLVYFYSSPLRCIGVILIGVLIYL